MKEENAVVVRGAYKRYSPKAVVLRGLNMTVPQGCVYGFLGPSGCGKTTLLSCVVGRSSLDAGTIELNVKTRSCIGYMPQELALFKEFSIAETLSYFASLYGISWSEFQKRKQELYRFLDLPDENSTIDKISGGQQRRVSLCVALLHNPQLLILDEPTVGVDPVLSQTIWQHLLLMSSVYNKTIIITTHYIEEARQAHRIGLMRGGLILDEHAPNQLMINHHCDTLEQVFLLLSQKQANSNNNEELVKEDYPKPPKKPKPPITDSKGISIGHINSHIIKSFYWMKRNPPIVAFLMILPIMQCVLFDMTIGRDPLGLRMGIVNDEFLNATLDCLTLPNASCTPGFPLSCTFLKILNSKTLDLVDFPDIATATKGVETNDIWGFLHFTRNYSDSLMERIAYNLGTPEESAQNSEVGVSMDMSNQYIGNLIRRDLYFGYLEFLEKVYEECKWPVQAARIPIRYEPAVYGDNKPRYTDFAVPAVLQLFEFYLPMMFTVGAILMEKREGILERSLISGMSFVETMVGHAIVQFGVLAVQTLFMMIVLFVIYDNTIKGSLTLALALLFLVGLSGMCYGYLVAVICDKDQTATYVGLGSFFPLSMLSGMLWPYEGMHYLLRSIGWFLPLTMTTDAFRAISTRAWSITHPVVYAGFLSAVGWIAFFSVCTYMVLNMKKGFRPA